MVPSIISLTVFVTEVMSEIEILDAETDFVPAPIIILLSTRSPLATTSPPHNSAISSLVT